MALQMDITLDNDISLTTGYYKIRLVRFVYIDDAMAAELIVDLYKDSTARSEGKATMKTTTHICTGTDFTTYFADTVLDTANNNPRKQGYVWLKTLSEFSTATDV